MDSWPWVEVLDALIGLEEVERVDGFRRRLEQLNVAGWTGLAWHRPAALSDVKRDLELAMAGPRRHALARAEALKQSAELSRRFRRGRRH